MKPNHHPGSSASIEGTEPVEHVLIRIPVDGITLTGELSLTPQAKGIVIFAHGSGSSRHSPRNQSVARVIQATGTSTLLFDLLTREEEAEDERDGHLRFDIDLLAQRLIAANRWIGRQTATQHLGVGYFGASTGGAAALVAAAEGEEEVDAIVCRGARPDLAGEALERVHAPTLLVVGGRDNRVLRINRQAYEQLRCKKQLIVIPGATHLFEEPGSLNEVAAIAAGWFKQHLKSR